MFIITDQQRYDALGIAGNNVLKTPNLDRLAKSGAFFKNAYTPAAVCTPARSSILTGHTIENTGMVNNEKAYYFEEEGLMTMPTFDEVLVKNGYVAEYYGKWHSQTSHTTIYSNPAVTSEDGKSIFDHGGQDYMYQDYLKKAYPFKGFVKGEHEDHFTNRGYVPNPMDRNFGRTYEEVQKGGVIFTQPSYHGTSSIPAEHSMTAFQAKQTIDAIDRLKNKDKPFSLTCSFHYPHAPMIPVEPYASIYDPSKMIPPANIADNMANSPYAGGNGRKEFTEYANPEKIKFMMASYYALISEVDHWVGEIMNKLDEEGLTENTLIVFTSDHGEMLGAHGMREKNVFYEESSHIPLLVSMPGVIPANTVVHGYTSTVDLFATIIDYLGVGKYASNGESLRGMIEDTNPEQGKFVITEWDYRGDGEPNYMIVKDGWKMMIPKTATSRVIEALFDLNTDPGEVVNLIGSNPNAAKYSYKVEELRKDLLSWLEKNGSVNYDGVQTRRIIK